MGTRYKGRIGMDLSECFVVGITFKISYITSSLILTCFLDFQPLFYLSFCYGWTIPPQRIEKRLHVWACSLLPLLLHPQTYESAKLLSWAWPRSAIDQLRSVRISNFCCKTLSFDLFVPFFFSFGSNRHTNINLCFFWWLYGPTEGMENRALS